MEKKGEKTRRRPDGAIFQSLMESAPDGIVVVSDDGRIHLVNHRAEILFGYTHTELKGRKIDLLFPERFKKMSRIHWEIYLSSPRLCPIGSGLDLLVRRKDGSEFPVEISLSPAETPLGKWVVAIVRDATEKEFTERERNRLLRQEQEARNQAETAKRRLAFLSEAGALLSSSIDYETTLKTVAHLAVPDMADACNVDLLTEDGKRIERVASALLNPEKERLLEAFNREHPIDPSWPDHPIAKAIRTGRAELLPEIDDRAIQAFSRNADSPDVIRRLEPKSYLVVPLVAHNQILGALSFWSSESNRRFNEEDLSMAGEVARRATLAISNARLYREAQERSRFKSQFVSTMSHELRTPLNAIIGYASLLRNLKPGGDRFKREEMLDRIYQNGRILLDLINNLLDLSQIEAGKIALRIQEISLGPLVKVVLGNFRPMAEEKGLKTLFREPPECPPIQSDPVRLRQIFTNLISNAIYFTQQGEIQVRILHHPEKEALAVEIQDTGIGIQKEDLTRIFEPFYQVDTSDTRTSRKYGLGLTIVKHLAELLGGEIEVRSQINVGTAVTLFLPYRPPLRESDRYTAYHS